ncbi:exporter of polyketide antibiotics [Citricoccus zhacaiensis]|uniref:Exporter of polyketide antibiotics n=1 Tax=Citricoccus zhacaiensis TaxID=489142 RepID=A0ABQ2M7W1_9MICC|nr:polyketide antibiotic transporter [Citricoccus zhacaiensis]GGO48284.1 exporter of polyketide antibiotics [Citricoccus zhacaiensis]
MTALGRRRPLRAGPAHAAPKAGSPFTGTGALLRLNLRLDRVRILLWTVAVGLGVYGSVYSLDQAFTTEEAIQARGALLTNPATIMMTGPAFAADDYTFGAMVANELSLYVFLTAAIMAILLAVRHTRAEEESGRLEMIRALPVGRFAPAAAAVATVALACFLVGAATTLGLVSVGHEDLGLDSSLALGAGTALTGMVFAALATVAAQLTEHARSATGMAMAGVAVAYLLRGVGDVIENTGSWLSWFSPFAWAQQTRLFVDLRWWPLAVSLAVIVVLFALAIALSHWRDLGAGLRPARRGPATAAGGLHSTAGLAGRLQRSSALAWGVGVFFFAIAMGSLANSLDGMLEENPALAEWIAVDGTDLTAEFAAVILSFVMIAPLILGVSGILALQGEESTGRSELLLVSGRTRSGYLAGWSVTVIIQVAVLTLLGGVGVGVGVWAGTGDAHWVGEMAVAAAAYLPALLVAASLALALFGFLPRWTLLAWLFVVWIALALFLGDLLQLPDWALDLSPFTHTPALPGQDAEAAPLLAMTAIAVALTAMGFWGYRRRDLQSR